ncbi:MAG: hypothetical protein KA096_02730 [Bacteroidales bacterium]|nr:hypothetical protein [Bacteroidales bacterium]
MNLYPILIHMHSIFRWVALILIVMAIIDAVIKLKAKYKPVVKDSKWKLFAMIILHVQFIIGLILYFISPKVIFDAVSMKNSMQRFFLVEHIALMIIAIVLITVGHVKSKRAVDNIRKQKLVIVYYGIGLLLILLSIPWPFRNFGAGWL